MTTRLTTAFETVLDSDISERFVLAGSFGRAAILGDANFLGSVYGAESDVDLIDPQGSIRGCYPLENATKIDLHSTKWLHREQTASSRWGLYDPHDDPAASALVNLNDEWLGIEKRKLPFLPGTEMATFGPCAQVALYGLFEYKTLLNVKHRDQLRRLRQDTHLHQVPVCSCVELQNSFAEYKTKMRQRYPIGPAETAYLGVRAAVGLVSPAGLGRLQQTNIGRALRRHRKGAAKVSAAEGTITAQDMLAAWSSYPVYIDSK
jgi:hypothetical protein